jgi:hypothetical protein
MLVAEGRWSTLQSHRKTHQLQSGGCEYAATFEWIQALEIGARTFGGHLSEAYHGADLEFAEFWCTDLSLENHQ